MAATRLITMHQNKGKSVAKSLSDRTDYAKNGQKTENGQFISSYACQAESVDEEFILSKREYERLMQLFNRNKITCPALGNRRVVMTSNLIKHLYYKGKAERENDEIINRIRVMPFIPSIIQGEKDCTKLIDVQKNDKKNNRQYRI